MKGEAPAALQELDQGYGEHGMRDKPQVLALRLKDGYLGVSLNGVTEHSHPILIVDVQPVLTINVDNFPYGRFIDRPCPCRRRLYQVRLAFRNTAKLKGEIERAWSSRLKLPEPCVQGGRYPRVALHRDLKAMKGVVIGEASMFHWSCVSPSAIGRTAVINGARAAKVYTAVKRGRGSLASRKGSSALTSQQCPTHSPWRVPTPKHNATFQPCFSEEVVRGEAPAETSRADQRPPELEHGVHSPDDQLHPGWLGG